MQGEEDAAWERITAEGRLAVATDASYPPFAAVDAHGNLFGFDIDLAEEIGRRWGVAVAFENLTYDALLGALIVGRDDVVISAFVPQPERTREVAYTRSYFVGGTVAVIRADDGEPLAGAAEAEAWAAGKTLAVEYGAGGDALARLWARRVVGVTVRPMSTAAEALAAVEAGQSDAAVVDALAAYGFLAGQAGLALAGPPIEPEPYVVAVSIESPVLLRRLEETLAEMEADGTMEAMRVRWFGAAAAGR
jgi:polar amino acid transport system substrate-binding protein